MTDLSESMVRGDTHSFEADFTDDDGNALDLSAGSATATFKRGWAFATSVFVLASPAAIALEPDGVVGRVRVTIPPASTAALRAPSRLVFDVEAVTAGGVKKTVRGTLALDPDAT